MAFTDAAFFDASGYVDVNRVLADRKFFSHVRLLSSAGMGESVGRRRDAARNSSRG
jgi:hypothetical protein